MHPHTAFNDHRQRNEKLPNTTYGIIEVDALHSVFHDVNVGTNYLVIYRNFDCVNIYHSRTE